MTELAVLLANRQKAITTEADIEVNGYPIHVTVRPLGLSPATQVRLAAIRNIDQGTMDQSKLAEATTTLADALAEQIAAWDLVGADGETAPISRDRLREWPMDVLLEMFQKVSEAGVTGPLGTPAS